MADIVQPQQQQETDQVVVSKPKNRFPQPGKFDDMARYSQEVVSANEAFDGIRLEAGTMLSSQLQASNTFHLGASEETPGYALTTVYNRENGPTILAKYDSDVKFLARSIYTSPFFNGMLSFQITRDKNYYLGGEGEFKIQRTGSNLFFKYDIQKNFTTSIFQSLSKKWAVGGEFTSIPSQGVEVYSLGVRRKFQGQAWTAIVNSVQNLVFHYSHRKDNIELGSELAFAMHPQSGEIHSKTSIGARYIFQQSLLKVRADTDGAIVGMYEENLNHFVRLCFCATVNYFTNDFKIGLGIQVSK